MIITISGLQYLNGLVIPLLNYSLYFISVKMYLYDCSYYRYFTNGTSVITYWKNYYIPEGYHYYFQFLSTQSESWKPVNNATISLDLNTTFNQIAISICPEGTNASRFIIGL